MKRYGLLACIVALVGAVAFVAGRATSPVRTETRVVTTEGSAKTVYIAVKSQQSSAAALATDKGKVITRIRRFSARPQPAGCPPCEETETRVEQKNEVKTATASETKAETQHQTASVRTVHTEQTRVVEAEKPRWMVGLLGGLDLSGSRHWGGMVSARVAGPFEVGLAVVPSVRAGFAVVGVRW